MTQRQRLSEDVRREQILSSALHIATTEGFNAMTRDKIAEHAGISTGTINNIFGKRDQLDKAVMRAAIQRKLLSVIATGIANGMPSAMSAPIELRKEAMLHAAGV